MKRQNESQSDKIGYQEETLTTWEKAANTRYGAYISSIEKRAIWGGHKLLPKPSSALEIGCEGGRWSRMLADLHWDMTCIEVNEKALRLCKTRMAAANCILVDPNTHGICCASAAFDLLLCIEVPSVIQSEWFIREASRVLKKDGILISVVHNLFSYRGLLAYIKATLTGGPHFYKNIYPLWKRQAAKQGFEILHEEGYCWFPFGRFSESALIPYFVGLEARLGLRQLTNLSPWVVSIARKSV